MSRSHMGTKNAGWGQPGDHYYDGPCRRCGGIGKSSAKGECVTTAEGWLQHMMDTQQAPGGTYLTASELFTLFQLMGRERRAMAERLDAMEAALRKFVPGYAMERPAPSSDGSTPSPS